MRKIKQLVARRTERRQRYEQSIHYAIDHAGSERERNELIDIAGAQGVGI